VKFHRGRVMKRMQAGSLAELIRQADRLAKSEQLTTDRPEISAGA